MDNILEIREVDKIFPGVHALKKVSFNVQRGSIHGLVGENGAGKSTLIKSITGAYTYTSGEILYNTGDEIIKVNDPLTTRQKGIAAAYQDLMIAPELSVGENFFLGRIPRKKCGVTDWKRIYQESSNLLNKYKINVDPRQKMKSLTVSQQAMVIVAKLSSENAKLIIFDEPTALLPNQEVQKFYEIIRKLNGYGVTIIYISHRLDEIMEICDTVTVLKDGFVVGTEPIENLNEKKMISMMVGREMSDIYNVARVNCGKEIFRAEHLTKKNVFEDVSFNLYKGEILGFFGLIGSGRTEVMRCIYGAESLDSGKLFLNEREIKIHSVKEALIEGIGLIPEDRRTQGLALGLTLSHNVNMADYKNVCRFSVVNRKKEKERGQKAMKKLNIKAYSENQVVRDLSGGNQQKVVISKVLCKENTVLIMDEPTVGVDVGAKREIYLLMNELTRQGHSILFISSYLPELLGLSDRVVVFHEGRVSGLLSGEELAKMTSEQAEETVLALASDYGGGD